MDPKSLAGRNILVVEDHMLLVTMMEGMLSDLGCTSMSSAATVGQALAVLDAQVFDAVTLDVNLNGVMSYPIAEILAARGIPFMFVTGYADQAIPEAHRDRPMLKKPYRASHATALLSRLLPSDTPALH